MISPTRDLAEIVAKIQNAPDAGALRRCVAEGLSRFGFVPGADANGVCELAVTPAPASFAGISPSGQACDIDTIHCVSIVMRVARLKAETFGDRPETRADRLVAAGLSDGQREVLQWAAHGKSNADIALILGKSKRAVDYHMAEILRKLEVSSRSQAVAIASGRPG